MVDCTDNRTLRITELVFFLAHYSVCPIPMVVIKKVILHVLAFVAAKVIGARLGRWDIKGDPPMGSPTNECVGLFMLWWGWFAFNAGSTFGTASFSTIQRMYT